jgi:hypothetical protein
MPDKVAVLLPRKYQCPICQQWVRLLWASDCRGNQFTPHRCSFCMERLNGEGIAAPPAQQTLWTNPNSSEWRR